MELKSPETPHPWETQHMPSPPPPKMRESRYFKPQHHPTMWLRRGPGVVALANREQSAPIVPSPHNVQSPGVPSHTQVREPQSAMRRQEQPPVQGFGVPAVQWRP